MISSCGWNSGWIRSCWGDQVLADTSINDVICSGIVAGTYAEMLLYLKAFSKKILAPDFAACERNGVDQGIHNVLVYKKMQHLPNIRKIVFEHQSSGVVAHMQAAELTGIMKYTGVLK